MNTAALVAPLALLLAACTAGEGDLPEYSAAESDATDPASTTPTEPATVVAPDGEPQMPENHTSSAPDELADACGARKVAPWIGQDSTVPVRRAVAEAAGAESDRWIYPDSVVTQDRRMDRLNVVMKRGTDLIVRAYCG
ncbi:MAG: I78 family peptidase inhibitor [Alteraurantiacibacter sp.]